MPKKKADPDTLGAQYREASDAVGVHRHREVQIDLERMAWLRSHRGVPSHVLYDRKTGDPIHPELIDLEDRLAKATADVAWCKAVQIAAGELFKGESFETVLHRHAAGREKKATKEGG